MAGEQLANGSVLDQLACFMHFRQAVSAEEACLVLEPEPELLDGRFDPLLDRRILPMPGVATDLQRRLVVTALTGTGQEGAFTEVGRLTRWSSCHLGRNRSHQQLDRFW
jgi:hypothetical protein